MAQVLGTDSPETLNADDGVTNSADTILGLGGADTIFGLGGNDLIKGGGGADQLNGGSGTDTAEYSDSGAGVTVNLGLGTGVGGTAEGDTLTSIENVTGSAEADFLIGNGGGNVLSGREHNDILTGGGGSDTLYGDSGNDSLKGGGGADVLNGGSGVDTAAYNDSPQGVAVVLIADTASGGDAEDDELNSIENVTGSTHDDVLIGNDGTNVLRGLDDDDTLKGFGGADVLRGGDGNDDLQGLDGDDTLRGESGNDDLDGGAGADNLSGGSGNDTYTVDSAGDIVTEVAGAGTDDRVYTSVSYVLSASADIETLEADDIDGTSAINLTGNDLGQFIDGNDGDNSVSGLGGADALSAYDGNDTVKGGLETDTIDGGDGDDTISGGGGGDYIWGNFGQDRLAGNAGTDTFLFFSVEESAPGEDSRDTIVDFSGADTIDVSDIDANTDIAGDQDFVFITGAFTAAGQIRAVQSGADTIVAFNTTGATSAEMQIVLQNFTAGDLGPGDFAL